MIELSAFKTTKQVIKTVLRASRRRYVHTFHAFDKTRLSDALARLGVGPAQAVLVHSSFGAFEGFNGTPRDVIDVIEGLVGPDGTILMPSLPFTGIAADYVRSGKITDIARTPSRMGLLTEVFRRQKGTLRSVHPTHPILARGRHAEVLLEGHCRAATPCGENSPFAKLLKHDGKILFMGTSIEAMTFFHYLEERFEHRLAPSPFTQEIFQAQVKKGTETVTVRTRLFDKPVSRSRCIKNLQPELHRLGGYATGKVGVLRLSLADAHVAVVAFENSLNAGKHFYDRRYHDAASR